MESSELIKPDYLFEVSWEVCNKVGGIHTVLSTKVKTLQKEFGDNLILIGPDVWKGSNENPEFIEDKTLFKIWRHHIDNEGLKIKIGRWNIPGKPIAVLVDFTPYFINKNEIFADLWIKYQLDSLTGQWDYIEPALFGYAAGRVIQCFYDCHLNSTDKIIAQFHEWMTGVGILYLKEKVPQIANVFTTHATVLGRSIAGNGLPFYSNFESFNPNEVARSFNVVAKHSLEKIAANNADCFTTVSEITVRECQKFLDKEPDVVTHNGFDPVIVPGDEFFEQKRDVARKKILQVAQALFNHTFPEDSLLIIKSGRYEFKNKGIDLFIDSLGQLNKNKSLTKPVIAFIFVPAHQTGPRKELLERMEHPDFSDPKTNEILTHYLQGAESDPVLNEIAQVKLNSNIDDKVKVIFVPTYLNGYDGVFDFPYYDLLIGFDLAIFPSYYEPWGYTPLESLAFHIPSVTTNISGFGAILKTTFNEEQRKGVYVIDRTDDNGSIVIKNISDIIYNFSKITKAEIQDIRAGALKISETFCWNNLIVQYNKAYDIALQKSAMREELFHDKPQAEPIKKPEVIYESKPVWRNIFVQTELPDTLSALQRLSKNLWLSWSFEAMELFEYIDTYIWDKCNHNPIVFIQSLSFEKIKELEKDSAFINMMSAIEQKFENYIHAPVTDKPLVAYFSMEYGLNSYIKLYSGGLGVLAGDYLKEASDQGTNIVGVGLLYKNGYFKQRFSTRGEQLAEPDNQDFSNLPLQTVNDKSGNPLVINIAFPGRTVYLQVWKLDVGRVPLYLLDTNVPENNAEDRNITSQLYGGDIENRLKQEIVLGIGGIKMIFALGLRPDIYHCNEGHSAFIGIERLLYLIREDNLSFEEAMEIVRSSTLFTTHTAISAANDTFSEELLRKYLSHKVQYFNINWEAFMALGRSDADDHEEKFSMTYLASKISQEINAVSDIHRKVSCKLLNPLWKNYNAAELRIGNVTNGVHYFTWTSKKWQKLYTDTFGPNFLSKLSDPSSWKKILAVPDDIIWQIRTDLKKNLITRLKNRLNFDLNTYEDHQKVLQAGNINEYALLIGFARRFVTYKRSDLILFDTHRLLSIINNAAKPVQFLFAGKAHPNDKESIDIIKHLMEIKEAPEFKNKIIFLEDYDIELAQLLVQGVDLWLNTPTRGMEASGTSGMKAVLNGVLNFSVLDGWWAEGYRENAGWALKAEATYSNVDFQNQLDAETVYGILENEIIPLYFERNDEGLPAKWINRIKTSIADIAPYFTMTRVLSDYQKKYYNGLYASAIKMKENGFLQAKEITAWKKKILSRWKGVDVISIEVSNNSNPKKNLGEEFIARIVLDTGELSADDIGIECVFQNKNKNTANDGFIVRELVAMEETGNESIYTCNFPLEQAGAFGYSFRIFPKNPLLLHKEDLDLMKWI